MKARVIALAVVAALAATGCIGSQPAHRVTAYFADVGDLTEGGAVQVNDVKVGSIADIALTMRDGRLLARVAMNLNDSARLPAQNLHAVVRQTSLLGEQFVELLPLSSGPPFIGASSTIPASRTDRRVDVETFLGDLSSFIGGGGIDDLNKFIHAQALILEDRGQEFGRVIGELERFTRTLANRRLDIAAAIDHLGSAAGTFARNRATLDDFFDSLEQASGVLADQGDELSRLFTSLRRFGQVNARFLARHESALNRQFRALRPVLSGLAGARKELGIDITQLHEFLTLFPKSLGGGPNGSGHGDYVQVDAVLCEMLSACHSRGEKGDVPGEGS